MIDEEILEQPQASSKPLSDFNDLHVALGLSEVRNQIEEIIRSEINAANAPPHPLHQASQISGQKGENLGNISKVNDGLEDFTLETYTEQDLIDRESLKPGEPKQQGGGEIIDFERPEYTLEKCLSRFMLVEAKTDVWDSFKNKVIKSTAFTKMVGKSVANRWQSHIDRKMIDADAVKIETDKQSAAEVTDLISRFIHLEGTLDSWDTVNREQVKNVTIREAYPNQFEIWFKSPHRRMIHHTDLVFDPTNSAKENQINIFTGFDIQASSDPDLPDQLMSLKDAYEKSKSFDQLLRHLCDGEKQAYGWLIRWLAYPLQNKGAKMATSVLMHGNIHGAGKSLFFGGIMSRIYTKYHKTLDQRDLESQYNDWADQVLFLLFEEISNNKTKHGMMGFIKHLITGSTLSIHRKFMSSMSQANHMNTVFLSNHTQPLPIEENDRRFCVLYPKNIVPSELLNQVVADLKSKEAIEAFYTVLLQVPLGDFNEHTKPPMTKAKREIIEYTKPGYDTFITQWIEGDTDYPYISCTSTQLYDAYQKWSKKTNEHVVSLKRFMGEAKKYGIVSSDRQEHWRMPSAPLQKKQTKVITIGVIPELSKDQFGQMKTTSKMDWLGEQIEKFDRALKGSDNDVPQPICQ